VPAAIASFLLFDRVFFWRPRRRATRLFRYDEKSIPPLASRAVGGLVVATVTIQR
jgi:hypothetical protein